MQFARLVEGAFGMSLWGCQTHLSLGTGLGRLLDVHSSSIPIIQDYVSSSPFIVPRAPPRFSCIVQPNSRIERCLLRVTRGFFVQMTGPETRKRLSQRYLFAFSTSSSYKLSREPSAFLSFSYNLLLPNLVFKHNSSPYSHFRSTVVSQQDVHSYRPRPIL